PETCPDTCLRFAIPSTCVPGDTTITTALGKPEPVDPNAPPQLVVLALADDLGEPSSRHVLAEVDEVWFARGARSATRRVADKKRILELRVPDRRMSANQGRLVRGPSRWVLDDPSSKNGTMVDGTFVRRGVIENGAVIELGHTAFLFRTAPLEASAALD